MYYQTKHKLGTEELQLYKLIIFGPPGVGKTSLFKVLLGKNPDQVRTSTGILDKKLVQVNLKVAITNDQSKSSWHLISIKQEILRLRSTIKRVTAKPQQAEVTLPAVVDVVDSEKPKMKVEERLFQPSTEAPTPIDYASTLMACYDSGGQPEFFDVMPALTTIPTGNIMVFDLSKDVHLKVKSEFYEEDKTYQSQNQAHYTAVELMKTAIANIQSYSKSDSSNISILSSELNTGRLLVVGTHLDLCGQTMHEKLQKLNEIEAVMYRDVLSGGTMQMVHCDSDNRMIHPISNTESEGRDEAAQKIRTAIEDMSKYKISSNQVPINWLLFQLEVQLTGQLTGKDYIERSKCIEIATDCCINENELDYVLMYFHDLGILLHYSKVIGLKDIIFCNPQYLFDQLTELIKFKYYNATPLVQKKINKGIFDKHQLCNIYNRKLDTKGELKSEGLLELFTHLKIMSMLPNKHDQYFMPALLNPAPTDISLQEEYGARVCDPMLIKFKGRYFPRGMFCCLVTHLAQSQSDWEILFKHTYKNLIIFQNMPNQYLALFDEISHVVVEVHCKKNILQASHYDICDKLYKSMKKLCKQFKMNYDFKFGFGCKDCEKFAGLKLQHPFSTKCFCNECERSFQLNHDQLVWLMPSEFFNPQVLYLAVVS